MIAALLTDGYLRREGLEGPEAYVLMLLSASGGVIMASANDLIVMFLGLEILSIAVYVLAGMHLRRLRSGEAAIKYFVLGAFSSAFFLYGIALVYGATGTTNMVKIADFLATTTLADNGLLLAGFGLLLVGFGFKVAAVPFHSWAPDVYQGSPSPIVAYMASGVKAAGFAGLLRVFVVTFGDLPARLAADRVLARDPLAAGGRGAGDRADRREADARLLVDQPRRVHPGGGGGRVRRRRVRCALLPGRLHVHGGRRLRRRHRGRAAGRRAPRPRRTTRGCRDGSRSSPSPSPCSCWPRRARP